MLTKVLMSAAASFCLLATGAQAQSDDDDLDDLLAGGPSAQEDRVSPSNGRIVRGIPAVQASRDWEERHRDHDRDAHWERERDRERDRDRRRDRDRHDRDKDWHHDKDRDWDHKRHKDRDRKYSRYDDDYYSDRRHHDRYHHHDRNRHERYQKRDGRYGYLTCESRDYRYRECRISSNFTRVQLQRRLSDTGCHFNYNWGLTRRGIWVNDGCRATFAYDTSRRSRHAGYGW